MADRIPQHIKEEFEKTTFYVQGLDAWAEAKQAQLAALREEIAIDLPTDEDGLPF